MRLLEVQLEGVVVPLDHTLQGGVDGHHEPAEGAARTRLRLDLDVGREGLLGVALPVRRVLTYAHVASIHDERRRATSGF